MRNLKKILALVLALMMVLSVMVTASASFDDADEITYFEAVDVLAAAGVLKGDGNGNFLPTAELDRASAAVLISNILLGTDVSLIEKTATSYKDVPATHWASGYVAYCSDMGIISGDGAGSYYPDVKLDGYSFAKMLLVANYPDDYIDEEGKVKFGGNSWKLQVAVALKDHPELLAGLDLTLSANLTREEAAQMMLNTMVDTGALKEEYGIDTQDVTVAGLNGYKWTQTVNGQTTDITDVIYTDTYVESFASGTALKDVMAALGIKEDSTATGTNVMNTVPANNSFDLKNYVESTATIDLARNLDVYVTAEGVYKFCYTTETLVTATVADNAETTGDYKDLYKWTFGTAVTYAAKDAYTDGATYLVVIADSTVDTLAAEPKLAESVEGKITSKGTDYVRIDGVKYTFKNTADVPALGTTKVLYLATDGTVLACTNPGSAPVVTPAETLVYVLGFYSVYVPAVEGTDPVYNQYGELVTEGTEGTDAYYKRIAQCVTLDGEVVDYLFRIDAQASAWVTGNNGMKLRAVSVDSETGIAAFSDPTGAIAVDTITEAGVKVNDGTYNYYYNTAEYVNIIGTKSSVSVVEGTLKGAVDAKTTAWAVYTGEGTNKTISKIYYWTAPAGAPVVDPDTYYDMFIVANATSTNSGLIDTVDAEGNADTETVYYHTVFLSGAATEIMTYTADITAGAKSYQVDKYGVYVEVTDMQNVVSGEVENLYGTLATIGEFVDYDINGITVIDVTSNGNGTVEAGETVTAVYSVDQTTSAKTIVVIYITTSVEAE